MRLNADRDGAGKGKPKCGFCSFLQMHEDNMEKLTITLFETSSILREPGRVGSTNARLVRAQRCAKQARLEVGERGSISIVTAGSGSAKGLE